MRRFFLLSLLMGLSLAAPLQAPAMAIGEERRVRDMVQAGEMMPFEAIRSRVTSQVRGDYLGVEFDEPSLTYRFRFLVNGQVINVDVDARTGQRRRSSRSY
jgi:hypothetical protein